MAPQPPSTAQVVLEPHGPAAREALWRAVAAAKEGDPLRAVTVAVPSPYAGLSLRRELGSRSGLVNVRFLSLARVAELIAAPALAATGRRPLSPSFAAEAVHAALAADPGPFERVADHPSTARSLAATFRDLAHAGVTPQQAQALAEAGPRAGSVARLYADVAARTAGFYDEPELLHTAAEAVAAGSESLDEHGHIVCWLPAELGNAEEAFVRALLRGGLASVVLGLTGDGEVDGLRARALANRFGASAAPAAPAPPVPLGTRIVSAPDPEDEVRAVARRIAALADAGEPLHGMAVLYRLDEPYARLVPEMLSAAGIAWNGPSPRRLSDSVVARVLLGVLSLGEHDLARDEVAAWMTSGPVRDPADGKRIPAARWDAVSREAGVVSTAAQWADRLARLDTELERKLSDARSSDDEPEWRVRRLEGDRDVLGRLAAFVADLAVAVAPPEAHTWAAHAEWANGLIERYLGGEGRRGDWPDAELEAGRRVVAAVSGLGALDELAGPSGVDTARFRRALALELDVAYGRVESFGTGVFVGRLHHAYGMHLGHAFVLGIAEGGFPPRGSEDPLLPDRERLRIAGMHLRREQGIDERRDYLAALASARDVTLCFARADPRAQRQRLPARWMLETARALSGEDIGAEALRELGPQPWLDVIASFQAGVERDRVSGSTTEFDLRALGEWSDQGRPLADHPLATGTLGAGIDALDARASRAVTEYDGFVGAGHDLGPGPDRPVSPTALQDWAKCPFSYLLSRVLRVREVPKPEAVETITALDTGTLVHAILEDFVREARPRTKPAEPWRAEDVVVMRRVIDTRCDEAEARGITGRRLQWVVARRRITQTALAFLEDDTTYRTRFGSLPATDGLELAFGFGDGPPVEVEVSGGHHVAFRGRIDRLDVTPDGSHAIAFDYKTGYMPEIADDPVAAGTGLQLPVYALAGAQHVDAQHGSAYYWSTRGEEPAGYDLDEARRARFVEVVGIIADGIDGGSFPLNPGVNDWDYKLRRETYSNCFRCPYDRLCPPDRLAAFDRKIDDEHLVAFHQLEESAASHQDEDDE
jgi:ATP-dependent helicase/nuclease subunit B